MSLDPRKVFVGFSLVLAITMGACQPVQPAAAPGTPASSGAVAESETLTDTATLSATVSVTASESVTADETLTTTESISSSAVLTEDVAGSEENGEQASAPPSGASVDPALIEAGLAVYRAQYCGVCHTLDAAETHGTFGPTHNGMGQVAVARLADGTYTGSATTPTEYIDESIVDPQAYVVPGYATTSHRMPSYAHLDPQSLEALVAFLLAQ
jgi:mono/diheme cytochrome c family protein